MHSLPLSPPEDPQALQATTASLSPLHEGPLLPNPSVSPSAVLPTPPPSSESSPMMPTSGKTGTNHVSSVENAEEKGGLLLLLLMLRLQLRHSNLEHLTIFVHFFMAME